MKQVVSAWAIKACNYTEAKGDSYAMSLLSSFLGVFNFIQVMPPPCHDGMRIALFRTRDQARKAKDSLFYKKRYEVVKVYVTIEEVRYGAH